MIAENQGGGVSQTYWGPSHLSRRPNALGGPGCVPSSPGVADGACRREGKTSLY